SNGDYAKGRAKVAWKHVCKPKEYGGLRIKNFEALNESLLTKYLWNIASKKDLYDARMPKMIKLAHMIDEGVWKWPSEWRNDELEVINNEVLRLKNGVHDKVKWKCVDNSLMPFHTKLVMDVLSPNLEKINWHVLVWFKQCIPKHVFCLWIAMLERLQTQDNIMTWGTQTGLLCPLCSKERNQRIFRGEKRNTKNLCATISELIQLKLMSLKVKESDAVRRVADIWEIKFIAP
ncbi:RNA-directed DNA polymerase, eukaryota, reverse transcriptase zinc-binding domain protein, partial [Tanacetum coccineum]